MTPDDDRTARIRERAHKIWESEGRPDDRAEVHWEIAARIVDEEDAERAQGRGDDLDEAVEESFPASDPPSMTQPNVGIEEDRAAVGGRRRRGSG